MERVVLTPEKREALQAELRELRKWKRMKNCGRGRRKDIIKRVVAINRLLNPPELSVAAKEIDAMDTIFEK